MSNPTRATEEEDRPRVLSIEALASVPGEEARSRLAQASRVFLLTGLANATDGELRRALWDIADRRRAE